jgi:obg-like ATPase 1
VNVPDDRFRWLCETYRPKAETPAYLEICDIAGLVKGAAKGEGLGNAFLSHIQVRAPPCPPHAPAAAPDDVRRPPHGALSPPPARRLQAVDGIFHVCRAFDDADVVHVEDRVDPVEGAGRLAAHRSTSCRRAASHAAAPAPAPRSPLRSPAPLPRRRADLEIIHAELRAKDLERCLQEVDALKKQIPRGLKKEQKDELAAAEKVLAWLQEDKDVRFGDWTVAEIEWLNGVQFISAKPVVYLVNLSEKDYIRKKNKWLIKIHEWVQAHGGDPILPFSGALEAKLFDMPADEKAAYCAEAGCVSALPKIIVTGFRAVHLIYFFTCGPGEVRCWQIRRGTKAPGAAGTIHTDFERGFICAEVMHYEELRELGSENAVKAAGKYRQEGKGYEVLDGDVIFFKFNVTAEAKKK